MSSREDLLREVWKLAKEVEATIQSTLLRNTIPKVEATIQSILLRNTIPIRRDEQSVWRSEPMPPLEIPEEESCSGSCENEKCDSAPCPVGPTCWCHDYNKAPPTIEEQLAFSQQSAANARAAAAAWKKVAKKYRAYYASGDHVRSAITDMECVVKEAATKFAEAALKNVPSPKQDVKRHRIQKRLLRQSEALDLFDAAPEEWETDAWEDTDPGECS